MATVARVFLILFLFILFLFQAPFAIASLLVRLAIRALTFGWDAADVIVDSTTEMADEAFG